MRLVDWLTILGLIVGPVVAVIITLVWGSWSQTRDRRMAVLRQILLTRYMPGDPGFHSAMNLAQIEFHSKDNVMEAWRTYLDAANRQSATPEHINNLITEMMRALGFKITTTGGAVRGGFFSTGFAQQQKLQIDALQSIPRIAEAAERSAVAAEALAGKGPKPSPK